MTASSLLLAAPLSLAAPRSAPASSGAERVLIINTGTRTVPGYQVTVEPDGRVVGTLTPHRGQATIRRTDRLIAPVRQRFFADLANAAPLSALPLGQTSQPVGGRRGRRNSQRATATVGSVSGPQLLIRYRGEQSPNLRDVSSTTGRVLLQDVKQVIQTLRFPVPERF